MSRQAQTPAAPMLEGVVSGLRERAEPMGRGDRVRIDHIVTFTLHCADERPEVIMRGEEFEGVLFDRDRVAIQVSRQRRPGATVNTVMLVNLTRGGTFGLRPPKRRSPFTFWLASAAILLPVAVLAITRFSSVWS